jgi:hypothetical protein
MTRVHQHDAARQPSLAGLTSLIQRDQWLGLEDNVLGHACLAPAVIVRLSLFRQIKAIGHRQAGVTIGNR